MARIYSTRRVYEMKERPFSLDLNRIAALEPDSARVFRDGAPGKVVEVTLVTLDYGQILAVDEKYPDLLAAWKGKEAGT